MNQSKLNKPSWAALFFRFVNNLPVSVPAAFAVFCIATVALLVLGQMKTWLVVMGPLPLAVATFVYLSSIRPSSGLGSSREQRFFGVLTIGLVSVWCLGNLGLTAQNLFVYRDSAVYSVAGAWLVNHDNLEIRTTNIFDKSSTVIARSAGFATLYEEGGSDRSRVYAQGLHALPALSGLLGRFTSYAGALKANVLIAPIALLAFYGFARLLVRPRWAFFATAVLSVSLPFLYFSRDMYTEIMVMALVFGSLSVLWAAYKNRDGLLLWLIAGLTLGGSALVRIDSILFIAPVIFAVPVIMGLKQEGGWMRSVIVYFLGFSLAFLIGWLDLVMLSKPYFVDHRSLIYKELAVLAALLVLGVGWLILTRGRKRFVKSLLEKTRKWSTWTVVLSVVLMGVLFMTRPYWHPPESIDSYSFRTIAGREVVLSNHDVDPIPYKTEAIPPWVVSYVGITTVALGVLGVMLLTARVLKGEDFNPVPFLLAFYATAFVYFIAPSITRDHIWAIRRFLPVVIPGFIALAVYGIENINQIIRGVNGRILNAGRLVLCLGIVYGTLTVSSPFLTHRLYAGDLRQIQEICDYLPDDAMMFWAASMSYEAVQTTRSYCGIESMRLTSFDEAVLREAYEGARSLRKTPFVGFAAPQHLEMVDSEKFTVVSANRYEDTKKQLYAAPQEIIASERTIMIAELASYGLR